MFNSLVSLDFFCQNSPKVKLVLFFIYIFIKNIKPDGWSWGSPFIQGASDEKDYLYTWGNNSATGYTENAVLVSGSANAENAIYAVKMPQGNFYGIKYLSGIVTSSRKLENFIIKCLRADTKPVNTGVFNSLNIFRRKIMLNVNCKPALR